MSWRNMTLRALGWAMFTLSGIAVRSVPGASLSQERFQITTFGAEKRARWSLEGKTAVVTGGTKVCGRVDYDTCGCYLPCVSVYDTTCHL